MNQLKTGFHLSIDVENLSRSTETLDFEHSLDPLLFKLNESNIKATFFVLGQLVTRWKTRIAEIQSEGHEVALHGYSHTSIEALGKQKFTEETKIGCDILSEALGHQTYGYKDGWQKVALLNLYIAQQHKRAAALVAVQAHEN